MEKLAKLRVKAGLTQDEAARLIGVIRPTLAKWELEDSQPRGSILPVIAKAYGCKSVDELYSERELREAGLIR